jgi:hypothetical protein
LGELAFLRVHLVIESLSKQCVESPIFI